MEPDVQSALLACSSFFRWRLQTAEAAFKSELETALAAATQDEEQLGQLQLAVAASQSEVDRLRSELSAAQQLLERETAACTGHQAHGRCLQQQLDAAQAELSVSQKLGEAVQAQLEQAALEMAALQARLAVAERTSDELAATQQAASEQSRELQTAQRAAERLGQQLQLADAERAGATDAELQLRGRVAKLEVAVADESMKAELQASKAQSLQRQLADEQHRVSELALQLERHQAHDKVIKDLKEDKKALQEEKMMLEVQLQAAHAALAGFGRSLSRAAADQCPHSGELTEVGSESLASEAPGGHAEEGTSPAALEGIDCDAAGYCTENDSIGPQASSGSMDGEGIAHERDTGRDVRGRGDSSASEEAIGDAADGLLQMVVDQQQRIEGLDAALRAAEDRHTVSTAVAKQTVQKLMMEVGRTEASGKALQQSLLERDRQLNTLQQEHECASRQGALFEAQIAQLTAALQQHDSDKARLEVERGQQLAALQAALEQQRSASQQAAALQAELASLQAQLAEERAAAQQQLAQQLAEVKGRGQGDARQAAASLQAAQNEIQQLRAKLENTEAVAQVVIGKLEAKLVARQGSSHEVAAKLQARCTAAARAAHDAMHALQSERELWSCVRATYIERVGKLERALRREVLLRRVFSFWRHLSLCSALSAAQGALCDASVAAKAAKAVAELERAQTIQSIKPEPQLRQPFVAHSKQPDMPLAMTSPLSHVQQPQQQQVLQQLQFPAQQQGMMSLVPFTIPAVGTTGSPAILAMPLQLAAFGQPPASASLVQPFASQQGGMQAQPVQGLSPSPAGAERMLSLAATRSKLSSGTASAPAQPLLPAQQQPMLAEESADWTTVSTEAVVESTPSYDLHEAGVLQRGSRATLRTQGLTVRHLSAGRVKGSVGQAVGTVAAAVAGKATHQRQPSCRHGLGGSPPDVILPLTKATAALNAGCQEPGISALTPAGASPAQQPFAASRKVPPGVKKMLTGNNSPLPWVPSSRHARVLQSFDMKPGAAVRPQSSGRRKAGAGSNNSHALALEGGMSSTIGALETGTACKAARTLLTAAAELQQVELPNISLGREASRETAYGSTVPMADPVLMSAVAATEQATEAVLVQQGQQSGVQPAVARARVQTPEGALPEPRQTLPTMYPLLVSSGSQPPEVHCTTAAFTGSNNEEGSECTGQESMPSSQLLTGATASSRDVEAACISQPTDEPRASVEGDTQPAALAAACSSLAPRLALTPGVPAPPTCEAGSGTAVHPGVQVRRVALNTPVIVRRGVVHQVASATSPALT